MRRRHKWGDIIKINFQEVGGVMHWIDLAQNKDIQWALVNTVINLRFP